MRILPTGGEFPENIVLSSHVVNSLVVCGELCLCISSCTGFNYKTEGNQSKLNCQLTDSLHQNLYVIKQGSTWDFYQYRSQVCVSYIRIVPSMAQFRLGSLSLHQNFIYICKEFHFLHCSWFFAHRQKG